VIQYGLSIVLEGVKTHKLEGQDSQIELRE